jgi:hypothetical protein
MAGDRSPVIVRRVAAFLDGAPGVPAGSHVLVAISGGPDSVALAAALAELGAARDLEVTLAHLRHGLREPDGEVTFQDRYGAVPHGAPRRCGRFGGKPEPDGEQVRGATGIGAGAVLPGDIHHPNEE